MKTSVLHSTNAAATQMVRLDKNENAFGTREYFQTLVSSVDLSELARYPQQQQTLLVQLISERAGVCADQVFLGNGSSEILMMLGESILGQGTRALVSSYTFELYGRIAQQQGAHLLTVDSRRYGHNVSGIIEYACKESPAMIFIDNPCNPTGCVLGLAEIEYLVAEVPPSVVVVFDEAYFELVSSARYSTAAHLVEHHPNVVVSRTFSKAYGLAGIRLGYCIAHPSVVSNLRERSPLYKVGSLAMAVGIEALKHESFVEEARKRIDSERARLIGLLGNAGSVAGDAAANFIFLSVPRNPDRLFSYLVEHGVLVRRFDTHPNHLRVTVGLPHENNLFLNHLHDYFQLNGERG